MISRTSLLQADPWYRELATAVTDPEELLALLGLDRALLPAARAASRRFSLRVPRGFIARMRQGDPADPLLRQVLPLAPELEAHPGFVADPVADAAAVQTGGLLQKYQGRALLIATGACGIHCRYCFRRHFPYATAGAGRNRWRDAVAQLQARRDVHEVILSGGDPLSLADHALFELVQSLSAIEHLQVLRIHSRLPVVVPSRLTPRLCDLLAATRLRSVLVLHVNHPQEICTGLRRGLPPLRSAGVTLLNQSVLLRGVNDRVEVLQALSEQLFSIGVLPYYLHLLDPVAGARHFDVPADEARRLMSLLRARLAGYLVPRLVREVPGAPSKLPPGE